MRRVEGRQMYVAGCSLFRFLLPDIQTTLRIATELFFIHLFIPFPLCFKDRIKALGKIVSGVNLQCFFRPSSFPPLLIRLFLSLSYKCEKVFLLHIQPRRTIPDLAFTPATIDKIQSCLVSFIIKRKMEKIKSLWKIQLTENHVPN